MNLTDVFANHARNRPSHPAIIDGERVITYRELHRLVLGTADRLRRAGLREGDIVALAARDSADHLVLLHALLRLGAIVLPINEAWSAMEQAHFCASLGVAAAVGDAGAAPIDGVRPVSIDESWRDVAAEAPTAPFPSEPDQPALLLLSSGTTGMPKASMFSHARLDERFLQYVVGFGAHAGDRYLPLNRLSFGMPRNACMTLLRLGGTVVIPATGTRRAAEIVDLVARWRITWINLIPAQLRDLLALDGGRPPLLPTLRILNATSATLRAEERRAIRERLTPNFFEGYSATEGGSFTMSTPEDQAAHPDSVGRAVAGVELGIVDDDHRPLPPGTVGHIRVRGPAIVDGYYRNPAATALAFRGGWFYPGDLGRINAEGYLFLAGRRDDVINRHGIKIRPIDVEAALLAHPAVAEAAVVGLQGPDMRETPIAFVVLRDDVAEAELIAFCRRRLAYFEVPRRIVKLAEMPKTATGKIQKGRLKEALQAKQARDRASTESSNNA